MVRKKKKPKDNLTRKQRKARRKKQVEKRSVTRYVTVKGSYKAKTWFVYLVEGMIVIPAPLCATQREVAYKDGRILAAKTGCPFLPKKGLPDKHKIQPLKENLTPAEINEFYSYDGPTPKPTVQEKA